MSKAKLLGYNKPYIPNSRADAMAGRHIKHGRRRKGEKHGKEPKTR